MMKGQPDLICGQLVKNVYSLLNKPNNLGSKQCLEGFEYIVQERSLSFFAHSKVWHSFYEAI